MGFKKIPTTSPLEDIPRPKKTDEPPKPEEPGVVVDEDGPAVQSKFWTELPVPMKNATGVFMKGALYLGGGYTGNSKTEAIVYIHAEGKWNQLPPAPMKWSTLTLLREKLVLIGGRSCGAQLKRTRSTLTSMYTNKVAVWDPEAAKWDLTLPAMTIPRMCPVVINHEGYLIAAGGNKGSLDFKAEVLCPVLGRWVRGPVLPSRCLSHTSAVVGDQWYLMDEASGVVQYANISDYVAGARRDLDKLEESGAFHSLVPAVSMWNKLAASPPLVPFRIACVNSHLVALSSTDNKVNITAYVYQEEAWSEVTGRLPSLIATGFLLDAGPCEDEKEKEEESAAYVLGGETGQEFSHNSYKLTFMTCKSLKTFKKSRKIEMQLHL